MTHSTSSLKFSYALTALPASPSTTPPVRPSVLTTKLPPDKRGIKRGFRAFTNPLTCGVRFQHLPVWLWALRPKEWSAIYITDPDERRIRQDHPSLWNLLHKSFVSVGTPVYLDPKSRLADVWWVSGTQEFLDALDLHDTSLAVCWGEGMGRRPPRIDGEWKWSSLTHSRVGGVTNARALFGSRGMDRLVVPADLPRSLGHAVKHSIRPTPCPQHPPFPHAKLSDALSIRQAELPVVYPTYMSSTGWGFRSLTGAELEACFDLPDYVSWDPTFLSSLAPLQLFRSVVDVVIDGFSPTEQLLRTRGRQVGQVGPSLGLSISADRHWITSLGKWLPGSWADPSLIAARAVKSDDAVVACGSWHRRIALVLPCDPSCLHILERFLMTRWRRNLIRSLFSYLTSRHGENWVQLLSLPFNTPDLDPSFRKRKRSDTSAISAKGGLGCHALRLSTRGNFIAMCSWGFRSSVKHCKVHGGSGLTVLRWCSGVGTGRNKSRQPGTV